MSQKRDGFDQPYILVNSLMRGFAAKHSSVANAHHLKAKYRVEDLLITAQSIPQGSIEIFGNISPETGKQQGVSVCIDSSEFGLLVNLMMQANPKRTLAAIAESLNVCSRKWPERHWDVWD
jgi:hypothetical protein